MKNTSPGKSLPNAHSHEAHWGCRAFIICLWVIVIVMSWAGIPTKGLDQLGLLIGNIGFSVAMFQLFRYS